MRTRFRLRWRAFLGLVVLVAAYLIAALIGRLLSHPATGTPLVWLPPGAALAAVLLLGLRRWPAVWIASLIAQWALAPTIGPQSLLSSPLFVSLIATGDTLAAVLGAVLARRFVKGDDPFLCARDSLHFAVYSALGAGAAGATFAAIGGLLTARVPWNAALSLWLAWWLAYAVGIVVMTPLILAWRRDSRVRWRRIRTVEGLLPVGFLAVLGHVVVTGGQGEGLPTLHAALLVVAVLVWFAVRLGRRETSAGVFILALVTGWAAVHGRPPVQGDAAGRYALLTQIALGVVSVSSIGLAAGVTSRRRSRRRLDMYRLAALQTADHWMITDADGVVVEVNPAFEKVTGYSQAELAGKRPSVIKSGVHDKAFYESMWKTILAGEPYRGIVVNRRKNGELFYEMKTITPVRDDEGATAYFFSIGKDITDLKRAEEEIRKNTLDLEQTSERLLSSEADLLRHIRILESVLNSSNEGVIVADRDGRFLMFSPAAQEMIGIGPTEGGPGRWSVSYGVYLPDAKTPYPTEDLPLLRAIKGEQTDNVEMFIRNPSKTEGVWISVSGRPLRDARGGIIGGVIVARDITQDKWAKTASEELKATREEMSIAERIQKRFFPRTPPSAERTDIGGASRPAVLTGGDYFDYIRTPDGDLLLVVGDVSGHGFGPALLMASVRAYINALTASGVKARNMLRVVNRLIANDTRSGDFVTLLLARVDLTTGVCEYASAGHTTGFVLDRDGAVKHRLESMVPPLGVLPEIGLAEMSKFTLQDGDSILMVTDGITEAENPGGACFGEDRVLEIFTRNRHRRASEIVEALHETVARHCGGKLQDDITSIVFKFRPDPPAAPPA